MPFIEVKQGGGAEIEDGVYPVQLTAISDPKTVTAQRGPKAGQEIDLIDWNWTIDDPESKVDGLELSSSTSTASGPKSKMFGYLTALNGGKPPTVGATFEKEDLIGRLALATVRKDENGWARIENVSAMPSAMLGARVARTTGAPTNEPVAATAPLREAVAAGQSGDLPF